MRSTLFLRRVPHGVACGFLVVAALGAASAAPEVSTATRTIEEVMLDPVALVHDCKSIPGEFGISIQARTHYAMALKPGTSIGKSPVHQALQSFDCGGKKSTLYYYQFATADDLKSSLPYTKALIWGEGGRSEMHPEYFIPIETVLVIISSRDAEYFANAFFYGVPGEAGEDFDNALEIYKKGDYKGAEKRLREVTRKAPELAVGHLFLGNALFYQERYHEAIPDYERAASLSAAQGSLAKIHRHVLSDQLGMAYALDGRMPDAKALFEAAIRKDPDYPLSYYNLACVYAEMGELQPALVNLKAGHERRANMLPGEEYPDPRTDESFAKFLGDGKFKAAMQEMGY